MASQSQAMRRIVSSESNEWYTPAAIIEAVRAVMGNIHLDPASNEVAQQVVKAEKYFSAAEDGLAQEWHGTVFLNPPYGKTGNKSNQGIWSRKLYKEILRGNVSEAILLTKAVPGYDWWNWLFHNWPGPLCIMDERMPFWRAAGKAGRPQVATCLWYYRNDFYWQKFTRVFKEFGRVIPPRCPT